MCYVYIIFVILCPPLGMILGIYGLLRDLRNWRVYIFCIALAVAAFAYCYEPKGDPDLIRYFAYINSLKDYSLSEALSVSYIGISTLKVFAFFCWLAAKMGDPHLVPALSVFIVYYIGFYVTCRVGVDYNSKRKDIISYILFILLTLNFYAVTNNVRNVLAFCIIGYATFRDCYEKKRNILTYILYIFPLFLHESAILFLFLRILIGKTNKIKLICMGGMIFVTAILENAQHYFYLLDPNNVITNLLRRFLLKAYIYFSDTSSEWGMFVQKLLSEKISRILYISLAFFICILSYLSNKNVKEKINKATQSILDQVFNIGLLVIACTPMLSPQYWRFASVMIVFSGSFYLSLLYVYGNKKYGKLIKAIFLWSPLCMVLWMRRLIYCDMEALLLKPFVSSPIIVFISDLLNLLNVK